MDELERLEQKLRDAEAKIARQAKHLTSLNNGNQRRRAYIKKLHRMLDQIGWCFRCDGKMTRLFEAGTEFGTVGAVGWRCYGCGRTVYDEKEC
jgi:hypothetical protein